MAKRKKKAWSESVGIWGVNLIRLFEDKSGIIYAETTDRSLKCGRRSVSLRHRDRQRAIAWAKEQLLQGPQSALSPEKMRTASHLFALYHQHRTIKKVPTEQKASRRRAKMWTVNLGSEKDMSDISLRDWESFIEDRRSGAINARGERVGDHTKRRVVRLGTVAAELTFLQSVLNFGTRWREDGRYVLSENVARGYPMPREKNVRRPVADEARYLAVQAVAGQVIMVTGRGENKREEPSYLPGLLDFAWHSGRRINAILALKYSNLRLDEGPCGAILWPSSSDKCGKEWLAPINEDLRSTINEIRAGRQLKGSPFLFPNPSDSNRPATIEHATKWLLDAESLAGLEKQDGSLWHAYRRGWATARKRLPDVDVARAGGWSDLTSLKACYQQADEQTMFEVVSVSSQRRSTA